MLTACRCVVFAHFLLLATSAAMAQMPTGVIQGTIVNGSGAAIPAVTVTITNTATGLTREALTDDAGFFAFPGLPVGPYEVQASGQGYATRRQTALTVSVGQVVTLRLELGVAPAPETITVAGTAPAVDMTRSQVSTALAPTEVEYLPMRGRTTAELTLISPGVTMDPRSGGISVAGQPSAINRVMVDGGDRAALGALSGRVSQEAAQAIQVSTNAYTAEYGRTAGGIIHVATRSGSNQLNGTAFEYFGDTAVNGTANRFGGSLGGPLVEDRHFAYAIFDGLRHSDDAPMLEAAAPFDQDLFLARTDHLLSEAHRLTLRYNGGRLRVVDDGTAGLGASAHAFTTTATSTLGSTLVNEALLHAERDRETIGDAALGSVNRVQVADALTWLRGAHTIKTGFDVQVDRVGGVFADRVGLPNVGTYSAFVQDEWHFDRAITLNAGIRYDAETFGQRDPRAASIPSDVNNFGPRLGVAWTPGGSVFVARGGYGLVYGRTLWTTLAAPAVASLGDLESPRVQQASAGFDWEWMPNTVLAVHYLMMRGDRTAALPPSRYHGITAELSRRFAQGHQYRLSYTRSAADNTFLDRLGLHHRHRFVASVAVSSNRVADRFSGILETLTEDWMLSAIYAAQGGGTRAAWISIDPRLARDIPLAGNTRVTLLWEAFNLLNRPNRLLVDSLYPIAGTLFRDDPLFAPSLDLMEPRTMRVAVRLSF